MPEIVELSEQSCSVVWLSLIEGIYCHEDTRVRINVVVVKRLTHQLTGARICPAS